MAEALAEAMTEGAFINGALIGISENRQVETLKKHVIAFKVERAVSPSACVCVTYGRDLFCSAYETARFHTLVS